jgi:hypothetical protein
MTMPSTHTLSARALAQLSATGFMVAPNFMKPAEVDLIRSDMAALRSEDRFRPAGVGEASTNRLDGSVRQCEQCFLFPRAKHSGGGDQAGRTLLYEALDSLRGGLQQATGEPLDPLLTEGLYARYPHGGFYRRHIDSMPGTPQELRRYSFLLYANSEWTEADGGLLRVHRDGGAEVAPAGAPPSFTDVAPRAGTLVVFRSDMPHEVLDTAAERLAVAGWFNAPPQGSARRRKLIAGLAGALTVGGVAKLALGRRAAK